MTRLLSYYGDDFTGSTDVMEALSVHGVDTVLFTRIPTHDEFVPFANFSAFGLAGSSRSRSPSWMDSNLLTAFLWLRSLNAQFCHYKVCSTFDSSPEIGNIGRAVEIGAQLFEQSVIPLIVGAPQLKRYTFEGHLFAAYHGKVYRIDRHPVMSVHPVTPMLESDLREHLSLQSRLEVHLANGSWPQNGLGILDVHDQRTQLLAGERLTSLPESARPFVVGSSGVEYALMRALEASGHIGGRREFAALKRVDRIAILSGSVSPTTERQIQYALDCGFECVAVDPRTLMDGANSSSIPDIVSRAVGLMNDGRSIVIYTAKGATTDISVSLNPEAREGVGAALGQILSRIVQRTGVRRAIIAGGDTSSHALGQLDVHALTMRFPLTATPGSPLTTCHSSIAMFDGLEVAMKGGQVGADNYFVQLRDGLA